MKLNCIVVDDSAVQRITITKLVNESTLLNLVGEFANALEAKNCINNNALDLIFLDVEMPLISGFDLLDGLKTKPQIIFITSKADYALKAFDYEATDFLQKPISKERFLKAVKKATELQPYISKLLAHGYGKKNHNAKKLYIAYHHWHEAILKEAYQNGLKGKSF